MPLVRIDVPTATPESDREAIADVVYTALITEAAVPANDRFVVVSAHDPGALILDPHYLVERTDRAIIIQITLNAGRTLEVKKALYRAIAEGIQRETGMRTEDVMISLVEVPKENWSFGGGVAQYAD